MSGGPKYLKDGEDFGTSHFPKDFGFSASAEGGNHAHHEQLQGGDVHTGIETAEHLHHGKGSTSEHGEGHHGDGSIHPHGGGKPHAQSKFAGGGHVHPHGHQPVDHHMTEHGMAVHHAHGGVSLHHHDGSVTHYAHGGSPMHTCMADGGVMFHGHDGAQHQDASTHVAQRMAHGGHHRDDAEDKAMVTRGIRQHEDHEHHGEHTDLKLARGGVPNARPRIPRAMKPAAAKERTPIGSGAGRGRNQTAAMTPMPRNSTPGGPMDLGVEPSAEPDQAGSGQGIPQMRRGGRR